MGVFCSILIATMLCTPWATLYTSSTKTLFYLKWILLVSYLYIEYHFLLSARWQMCTFQPYSLLNSCNIVYSFKKNTLRVNLLPLLYYIITNLFTRGSLLSLGLGGTLPITYSLNDMLILIVNVALSPTHTIIVLGFVGWWYDDFVKNMKLRAYLVSIFIYCISYSQDFMKKIVKTGNKNKKQDFIIFIFFFHKILKIENIKIENRKSK